MASRHVVARWLFTLKPVTLATTDYGAVTAAIARQLCLIGRIFGTMRRAARKSWERSPNRSRANRIIAAALPFALACAGFLVTLTVRSWDQGLSRPGQAADREIVGASPLEATAHKVAPQPFESVLSQEAVQLRVRAMPARPPAAPTTIASVAAIYLAERNREETHNGKLR